MSDSGGGISVGATDECKVGMPGRLDGREASVKSAVLLARLEDAAPSSSTFGDL